MTYKITRLNDTTVDIQLAGTTFRDKKELEQVHKALKYSKSHNVKFRYQKDNKAEPNAIMVFVNDIHVGYIPKDFCESFKKPCTAGRLLSIQPISIVVAKKEYTILTTL